MGLQNGVRLKMGEGCTVHATDAFDQRGHQVQERLVDLTWGKLGSLRSRYERGVLRCYRDSKVNGEA